jgi:hypothetical protein
MAFEIIFSVKDEKDKYSTVRLYLPSSTVWTDAIEFVKDAAPLLEALIRGQITRAGIAYTVDVSDLGLRASPLSGSDVEEGANFIFTASPFQMRHRIPTFDESKILAGTREVDLTDADVDAWVDMMVDGITPVATLVEPCEWRGDDLEACSSAKEAFQRSRR